MSITNEEAMQNLTRMKANSGNQYWYGIFMGAAGAYLHAGVISHDQYTQIITRPLARKPT